ncbi:MAG: V-type ATPase subunit subunit G family protein [Nanoarchaeota archaeon]
MEAEILIEIRDSEKKADEIIERAAREKESILQEALRNSSKLMSAKEEEIRKLHEKKITDFKDHAKLIREEKLAEGKIAARQMQLLAEKKIPNAVEFVLKRFEEMI